ncbi:MAG: exodeoxyribonuclease VII large subunit [Pirellulaceae bacterium]
MANETHLTVSQFTEQMRYAMAELFGEVTIQGEVSDLTRAASGHVYFSLKDSAARLSAVIWRSAAQRIKFRLEEGQEVICKGGVDVYGPRGVYQLNVRTIVPVGVGELQLAFEQLRKKLTAEGLFAPERKRPLPTLPRRIAVVTSPQGAAVRDFLEVLCRRFRNVDITIVPTIVQGPTAGRSIAKSIQLTNRVQPNFDLIVICRGGGSMEDLWAFNEEVVVRAIASSSIPTITGIGHETDVTLSDLAADVRALTPSEAAERILPVQADLIATLDDQRRRMMQVLSHRYRSAKQHLDSLAERPCLRAPIEPLNRFRQRLDELHIRMKQNMQHTFHLRQRDLQKLAAGLEAMSPLGILARGYSLTTTHDGNVIRSADDVKIGDRISTKVPDGTIESEVVEAKRT